MKIEYRSIADLNDAILKNLDKLPHDIDLVVGIPRSGMLPANLIALYLNKPYTDIDSFIEGREFDSGYRSKYIKCLNLHKILVVDDSVLGGWALRKAKNKLKEMCQIYEFFYFVVYATSDSRNLVDAYSEIVERPRCFQWNIFHHPEFIPNSCFDIDGVLCDDPPFDDDGKIYTEYIKSAAPKYIPSLEINTIVTCRLEKYRAITEKWLSQNGVVYKNLVMLDLKNKEERIRWGKHAEYKGNIYKDSNCVLFVESSYKQALIISRISKKQVFCTETFSMIENYGEAYHLKWYLLSKCRYFRPILKCLLSTKLYNYIKCQCKQR